MLHAVTAGPGAWRSMDIRTECSSAACLCGLSRGSMLHAEALAKGVCSLKVFLRVRCLFA